MEEITNSQLLGIKESFDVKSSDLHGGPQPSGVQRAGKEHMKNLFM